MVALDNGEEEPVTGLVDDDDDDNDDGYCTVSLIRRVVDIGRLEFEGNANEDEDLRD
jgi:hypothetical protein